MFEGKPAAGAIVTFHKADGNDTSIMPNGLVQADGTIDLTTYALNDGIPPGNYKVVIYWSQKGPKRKGSNSDDEQPGRQLLPDRYLKPATSGIAVTITNSTTTLEPFNLKAK